MPSTAADQDQQRLSSRLAAGAGVVPAPGWLAACRSHLASLDKENGCGRGPAASAAGGEEDADADEVLRQILSSDLRDVVRRCGDGDDSGDGEDGNHPGRILRQAILASLGPGADSNNNHTVTRPLLGIIMGMAATLRTRRRR